MVLAKVISDREMEVGYMLLSGMSNREIAEKFCISEKTVKNHLTKLYRKLGVTSRIKANIALKDLIETPNNQLYPNVTLRYIEHLIELGLVTPQSLIRLANRYIPNRD